MRRWYDEMHAEEVAWRQRVLEERWDTSSKTCSGCGWMDEGLTLADRTFHCQQCGLVLDHDLNAAINLAKLAASSADTLNACGEASAGTPRKKRVKLSSVKQEPSAIYGLSIDG